MLVDYRTLGIGQTAGWVIKEEKGANGNRNKMAASVAR